jgi:hypothetical protein
MKSRAHLLQAGLLIVLMTATAWAQGPAAGSFPDPQASYPQASGPQGGDAQGAYPQPGNPGTGNPQDGNPQAPDPPGRVARLDSMTGQISVQPEGTGDWVEGSNNRPLTNADNVWADKDSRAELDLGTGLLRIDSETSLTLTNIDNNAVQVTLHQGALNVHVRHLYAGEVWEVDTPNLAFTIAKPGDYRFDVDPNGDSTTVAVREGQGEATGQGSPVVVHEGEWARFAAGNSLKHEINDVPPADGFDEWCSARDQRDTPSASEHYVNPDVVGSQDLDEYGTWKNYPDYGPVWTPTAVAPGWAPYSYGHWIWVSPWGWTWVDDAAWGFAPFHYGRWAYIGTGWGWIPGPYGYRPWYAPALVGWFGGPGWGIGFGGGFGFGFGPRYGWCPLGFREPFHPLYGASRGYYRNVNLSNARIANFNRESKNFLGAKGGVQSNHFANMNKPGGLNAVTQNTLQHGLPVHSNSIHVSPNDVKSAQALSRVSVNPTRESKLGANAGAGARPASSAFSRPTVSRMTPPTVSSRAAANQMASARGVQNAAAARTETRGTSMPSPAERTSQRPPASGSGGSRAEPTQMAMNHYVPRPPQSSMRSYEGSSGQRSSAQRSSARSEGVASSTSSSSTLSRSVPRPPAGSMSARNEGSAYGSSRGEDNTVSRPSGSQPRSYSGYSGSDNRGGYGQGYSSRPYGGGSSSRAYGSPYGGSYGGRGGYSSRAYGGESYGGRGGYSAPPRNNGNAGGHHGGGGGGSHGSSGSHGGSGGHGGGSHGGGHR